MKTREELITATLQLLNAVAAGQAPEAEDVETIDGLVDSAVAELNRRDIIFFTDTQEFDDEFVDPLATYLANMAAPSFGQPRNPDSVAEAIARMYAMRPSTYVSGSAQQTDYF
ncbi:hypothetical protein AU381_00075 [Sinorhizobium glycinis]|uniref:Uncharacterized protein n=1 Tax=Sinorhizobium glycinis TaxID=1472378 RepID=A0A178XYI1_9HYPH|nr:hypothetical protein [Sinorhizobium glycinis]OAP40360.1 hypothetical protein AU381_00075 [Sinorhizobium glycinis]